MSDALTLSIDKRFQGPPDSGNGGYVCGRLAAFIEGPAQVRLVEPPPLEKELQIVRHGEAFRLMDGDRLLAEATPSLVDFNAPDAPDAMAAAEAAGRYAGYDKHAFRNCFVCGPDREEGDGLRIFAGAVEPDGAKGAEAGVQSSLHAAPWQPHESLGDDIPEGDPAEDPPEEEKPKLVRPEFVWAALDCPGAFANPTFSKANPQLLGTMTADILACPKVGEPCIVTSWHIGKEGRKSYAGTALYGENGALLAIARQVWIEVKGE
ncbi:MAG: hypothetical protein R3360_06530 [Alphaproteobacteria bacterium]|nr:hypothetical protein [Alphaproteobacteria bacterium]